MAATSTTTTNPYDPSLGHEPGGFTGNLTLPSTSTTTPSTPTQPVPYQPIPTSTSPNVADPSGVLGSSTAQAAVPTYNVGQAATEFMQNQPTSAQTNQQYISPQATIAGQMTSLLNTDSPWMKVAETRANERANKAGLLSSSMAVGAAHRAAIEQALPVAQGDAATYAQSNLANQNFMNQGVLAGQASNLQMQQNQQTFQNQSALQRQGANESLTAAAVDANNKMAMEQYGQEATTARMQLEYQAKADIQKNTDNINLAQQQMQAIQETTKQYESSYAAILTNPDFADEASRNAALEKLRVQQQAAIDWITSSYSTISFNGEVGATTSGTTSPTTNTGAANTVDYGSSNISGGGALSLPGSNATTPTDKYYANIASQMPPDYSSFNQALINANGQSSDDFWKVGQELGTTVPNKDQQWDIYSKVMYAALNPTDAAAQQAAKEAIIIRGPQTGLYGTTPTTSVLTPQPNMNVAPSQIASIPLFDQWVNQNIYAPLQPQLLGYNMNGDKVYGPSDNMWYYDSSGKLIIQPKGTA